MTASTSLERSRVAMPAPTPLQTPLGQIIEPFRDRLSPFLRDGITLERVAVELNLASRTTPNMDKCVPEELVDAVCRALQTGGTIGQDVYIVPFFSSKRNVYEPTVMLDYKFKTELVVHAGGARSIDARPVWSDEKFSIEYGSEPRIEHTPSLSPDKKRTLVGAYAVAFLGFNHKPKIQFMPIAEIETIRKRSKQWNPEKVPVCPGWYACARVVHQIVKLLPKNARLRAVIDLMDREERDEFEVPAPELETNGRPMLPAEDAEVLPPDDEEDFSDEDIVAADRKVEQQGLGIADQPRRQKSAQAQGR
jgi:hypothetical protein